jgi:hypothetical protein
MRQSSQTVGNALATSAGLLRLVHQSPSFFSFSNARLISETRHSAAHSRL